MGNRLDHVDIAKGIGIILVVCSHTDALPLMWLFMGMFVPVFYFCSGYTFSQKSALGPSMGKRFRKLMAPYIVFNVLLFCVFRHFSLREVLGAVYSRYSLYPLAVEPNVKFLTSGNYPMWFLTSMLVTYLLFYLIVYYERHRTYTIAAYVVATIAFAWCPVLLPWSIDTAALTALFMYCGHMARRHQWLSVSRRWVLLIAVLYVALHLVAGTINLSVRMYGTSVFIYFFLGVAGSFLLLWACRYLENTRAGSVLLALGRHSLTIFCLQMAFIVPAKALWQHLFPDVQTAIAGGLFQMLVALAGGWLLSILLHRSRRLSRLLQFTS